MVVDDFLVGLPDSGEVEAATWFAVALGDELTVAIEEVEEDFVALLEGHGRLPEESGLDDLARGKGGFGEGVAVEGDVGAEGEGNGCGGLGGRGGWDGVDDETHVTYPLVGGFEGVFVKPSFDETFRVALGFTPKDGVEAVVLGRDFFEGGDEGFGFGPVAAWQGVNGIISLVVIGENFPLVGGIEDDACVGVVGVGDGSGNGPVVGASEGRVGVHVYQRANGGEEE